jgi:hypothetical protein
VPAHAVDVAVFAALYATSWYAPSLRFTSAAALIFYGRPGRFSDLAELAPDVRRVQRRADSRRTRDRDLAIELRPPAGLPPAASGAPSGLGWQSEAAQVSGASAFSRDFPAALSSARAWSRVWDRLDRATRPFGGSTSVATFRPTRSCASAYLSARAREARAIWRYLMDGLPLSAPSRRGHPWPSVL